MGLRNTVTGAWLLADSDVAVPFEQRHDLGLRHLKAVGILQHAGGRVEVAAGRDFPSTDGFQSRLDGSS